MAEYSSEDYALANKLNAKLAIDPNAQTIAQAKELGTRMLDYIRSETEDYDDFAKRVELAEKYSLTESLQPKKDEKVLKVIYLRAKTLLETADEASTQST